MMKLRFLCFVVPFVTVNALDNGLALTPPMGWLTWERFRCNMDCTNDPDNCISEKLLKVMADRMTNDGFRDAGYEYIMVDDCWPDTKRDDKDGRLQPDPKRFPNGIKKLADYIHSKGLKFGIYEDFGTKTCAGFPGSEFYMETDAQTFADWGVDYLKFDQCHSDAADYPIGYPAMAFYLNQTGRPIVYSCEWPLGDIAQRKQIDYAAVRRACNLWRIGTDVNDSWESVRSILNYYRYKWSTYAQYAGPGGWNDLDMLDVGNFALSDNEERTQMGMFAMFAAPLIMSTDLRTIKNSSRALLQNKRLIAINQDPLGKAGRLVKSIAGCDVWTKELVQNGSYAIAINHLGDSGTPIKISFHLQDIGLNNSLGYNITEVFDGTYIGVFKPNSTFPVTVNPHGIVMYTALPLASSTLKFQPKNKQSKLFNLLLDLK